MGRFLSVGKAVKPGTIARVGKRDPFEDRPVLKTIFSIGLMAIVGLIVLKFAFGILGGVLALFLALAFLAVYILLVGAVAYLALRVVAPDTARRLRNRFSGTPTIY